MTSLARPRALDRRAELYGSLALAAASFGGLLLLAGLVVLFDLHGFQQQVESFFQVDLNPPELDMSEAEYARDAARNLSEKLIRGADTGIFSGLPGHPEEMPDTAIREARQSDPLPRFPRDEPQERPRTTSDTASTPATRRNVARDALPVLALRKVGSRAQSVAPGGEALTASQGGGLAALGTPGEMKLDVPATETPDAPGSRSLAPPPPLATVFARSENASVVSRRLVEERPPRGFPSLDDDILATFTVYRHPGDPEAYFQLEIALRPESKLPAVAKDVLFVIDISQSISMAELEKVRRGVVRYLRKLSPRDRWNVIVFSENTHYLHEDAMFVDADRFSEEAAKNFIDKRRTERRTDVFLATREILARVPASNRPCNVFLVSDGKATEGTSDVQRIVHDFQRVNRDNFAIFTFDAGPGGNLYLLSLLSYRSRGILASEPDVENAPDRLVQLARSFDRPVLTNVVASYTNIVTEDVYPDVLPNLYRDAPIRFWGRTTPGREVALRVAGLSEDGPREFFFRTVVPEGDEKDPEVLHRWARGKAHALVAQLADDPENEALRKAIVAFAEEHELEDILDMVRRRGFKDLLPWR